MTCVEVQFKTHSTDGNDFTVILNLSRSSVPVAEQHTCFPFWQTDQRGS